MTAANPVVPASAVEKAAATLLDVFDPYIAGRRARAALTAAAVDLIAANTDDRAVEDRLLKGAADDLTIRELRSMLAIARAEQAGAFDADPEEVEARLLQEAADLANETGAL